MHCGAVEVIAHPSLQPHVSNLSTYQLRQIYTMRQINWPDGKPVVVLVLSSNSIVHQAFSKDVLKIFPYQLDRIWTKLTYSGLGKAPRSYNNEQQLLDAVRNTPGAIGYVNEVSQGDGVYVLQIKE